MNTNNLIRVSILVFVALLLAACGAPAPDASETDRVATRVAEEMAVAMTLTAAAPAPTEAPTATPAEPTATIVVPTDTPPPPTAVSTEAPQATPVPTDTPVPVPTNTPVPPPTNTPPPPEPTATPILIAVLPVDGGGGERPNLRNGHPVKEGRNVALPGFSQAQVTNPMVFRDRAVFQVEVFDSDVGTRDGDGIKNVTFTVTDGSGKQVHERKENNAGYCMFGGGEPECDVWVFADHDYKWPDGEPIVDGTYNVNARINPENGNDVNWGWTFVVELP